jgi:hypothetical protein
MLAHACPHCGRPTWEALAGRSVDRSDAYTTDPSTAGRRPHSELEAHRALLPRTHGWPGKLFIGLSYVGAAFMALGALLMLAVMLSDIERLARDLGTFVLLVLGFAFFIALPILVARGVSRFANWSWWVTMIMLSLGILGILVSFFDPPADEPSGLAGLLLLPLYVIWIRYFWVRRADFSSISPR